MIYMNHHDKYEIEKSVFLYFIFLGKDWYLQEQKQILNVIFLLIQMYYYYNLFVMTCL